MAVKKLEAVKMMTGLSVPIMTGKEKASETYERGAVLIIDSGGDQVTEASTEPQNDILGIAHAAASGTTDTEVQFVPALPGIVFKGSIGTSTSAGAPADTDLLQVYPLALSSGDWFVDKTDNTNPCVIVIDIDDDQIGVTNGDVYFMFLSDYTAFAN